MSTDIFDPRTGFGPDLGDVWLEIGFGGGEHLAWQAAANPGTGIIGCEPFINGVAKLLARVRDDDLSNVRFYRDDARLLVERLPENSLGRAFILFPDPWPKTRHHKRRIVSDEVLGHLARALRDDAELRSRPMMRLSRMDTMAFAPAPQAAGGHLRPQTGATGPTIGRRRVTKKGCRRGRNCAFLTYVRQPRSQIRD